MFFLTTVRCAVPLQTLAMRRIHVSQCASKLVRRTARRNVANRHCGDEDVTFGAAFGASCAPLLCKLRRTPLCYAASTSHAQKRAAHWLQRSKLATPIRLQVRISTLLRRVCVANAVVSVGDEVRAIHGASHKTPLIQASWRAIQGRVSALAPRTAPPTTPNSTFNHTPCARHHPRCTRLAM